MPIITLKKEVSSPQTKYIPLNVHSLINYTNVLCRGPLATTPQTEKERMRQKRRMAQGQDRKTKKEKEKREKEVGREGQGKREERKGMEK